MKNLEKYLTLAFAAMGAHLAQGGSLESSAISTGMDFLALLLAKLEKPATPATK